MDTRSRAPVMLRDSPLSRYRPRTMSPSLSPSLTPRVKRRASLGPGSPDARPRSSPALLPAENDLLNASDGPRRPSSGAVGSLSTPRRASVATLERRDSDRLIAGRLNFDPDVANYALRDDARLSRFSLDTTPAKEQYKEEIESAFFQGRTHSRIVQTSSVSSTPSVQPLESLFELSAARGGFGQQQPRCHRQVKPVPFRILDAPELLEDYYLNLLDWSSRNVLAVALNASVYLWHADSGEIRQLLELRGEDDYVASVRWHEHGRYLAVGTSDCRVQLWDTEAEGAPRMIRRFDRHRGRVGALAWNGYLLTSGSRDASVMQHDIRARDAFVCEYARHSQEVCGLSWSDDGRQLASGGNDNLLCIWDAARHREPRFALRHHRAAVKGLAWCPWERNLLASGGGTADRTIRFWNTQSGACLNTVDTKSQVCAIRFSKTHRELISSHGFSQNQLIVWTYPTMAKVCELTGHLRRVLHMAMSPDGSVICSGSGDQTLRFWRVFERQGQAEGSARLEKQRKLSLSELR